MSSVTTPNSTTPNASSAGSSLSDPSPMRGWKRVLLAIAGLIASIAGLAGWLMLLARWFWNVHPLFELTTHASWHAMVGLSIVVIPSFVFSAWKRVRSGSSHRGIAWKATIHWLWIALPWMILVGITEPWQAIPWTPSSRPTGSTTVMAWNVLIVNENYAELFTTIQAANADVIVLTEVGPWHKQALQSLDHEYPNVLWLPQTNTRGIAILSRIPDTQFVRHEFGEGKMVALEARLPAHGECPAMSILGVHTASPNLEGRSRIRDSELEALGSWVQSSQREAILIGDFNISPWSPPFRRLLTSASLKDSRTMRGLFPTWPSPLGPCGIPIDHALTTRGLRITDRGAGFPSDSSDHGWITVTVSR